MKESEYHPAIVAMGRMPEVNRIDKKGAYIAGLIVAVLAIMLAKMRSFGALQFCSIFVVSSFLSLVCVFKLRNIVHGEGWIFPHSTNLILFAMSLDVGLYLLFSR